LNTTYKANIEAQIKRRKDELSALIEPVEVKNPNEDIVVAKKNKVVNERILLITNTINSLETQIQTISNSKRELLLEINELKDLKQKIESRENEITFFKASHKENLQKYNINIDDIIKFEFNYAKLDVIIESKENSLKEIKIKLGEESSTEDNYESLSVQLFNKNSELKTIKETLDEAEKKYQDYLMEKKKWEESKNLIIGNNNIPNTLTFFEKELKYITDELLHEITIEREERLKIVHTLFSKMKTILDIYKDIKAKIDSIIEENIELLNQYNINIEASFCFKHTFKFKFLNYISLNKTGTYYGKENAEYQINKIIEGINLDEYEQVKIFLSKIIESFFEDKRNNNKTFIENQVEDVVELYNYLFSLDFLDYNYQLRQGDKKLEQLSPGEKGALLLVFYLLLDNNNIPLIIDQPEDNLDNNSVANILVPFVKRAKAKRQIILVTHNPNLAVVSDAEQVIYVELNKENDNLFSFKSGSIEDREINDCIVKVLEGAMPAFNKRKQKYYE
jgi:predicted ATPase